MIQSVFSDAKSRTFADGMGYVESHETVTAYTGEYVNIPLDDPKWGGAQLVGKLFTEGLGRGPGADEYLYYMNKIEETGCTLETLRALVGEFFTSEAFLSLKLAPAYEVVAVYRAVLNRDPTLAEVEDYAVRISAEKAAGIALSLLQKEEFAALLPDIIRGPYFWGTNNASYSPSGRIITSEELNRMLADAAGGVVALEPGTLVLMDSSIVIPAGVTLTTKGNPTHYSMQARILRTRNNNQTMVKASADSTVSHIWVDGNRPAFAGEELLRGHNLVLAGDRAKAMYCRTNGTLSGTHLVGSDSMRGLYIAHNLVTCYETDHKTAWADGITHASTDSIIEKNMVVDATDVSIIVFRFVSKDHSQPQTTVVRNNLVMNLGNSAFAGLDIDSWLEQGATQNFRGTLFENNAIWTSWKAHQHICLSLAPLAWTNVIGDHAVGPAYINNYTPKGLRVLCAAAFAADGVHEYVVRGNHLQAYIGAWGRSYDDERLCERLSSVNSATADGDLQGAYEDMTTWLPYLAMINPHPDAPFAMTELKGAIFHEDRRSAAFIEDLKGH
ncbi:MAG: hypothetical protein J6I45_11980 [Clostridia bacterium]|nr:hypothetical protein [Clostridia bacterium]